MIRCDQQVRLNAYHDGELSPAERWDVEAHLRDCPLCAAGLTHMRRLSGAFAATTPPEPSHNQLLQLVRGVQSDRSDARMLLRLFRVTAIAAGVLLTCALAGAVYLSQRTRAAAHEAMVLDRVATWSQPAGYAPDPVSDERQSEQQVALAQWIADDLRGRQEER